MRMKTKEMSFQHNQSMAKTHTGAHTSHSLIILAQDLNLFTIDETHKIVQEINILYVGKEKSLRRTWLQKYRSQTMISLFKGPC
jgi:hypothetical protein